MMPETSQNVKYLENFIEETDFDQQQYWKSSAIADNSDDLDSAKKVGGAFRSMKKRYEISKDRYEKSWKWGYSSGTSWNLKAVAEDILEE